MTPTTRWTWDDYLIPGTATNDSPGVLRNTLGCTTQEDLDRCEEFFTQGRMLQLLDDPVPGRFDYEHMKEIHRVLFQDVYPWAGQERTAPDGPMVKYGPDVVTCKPERAYQYHPARMIAPAAKQCYDDLARRNQLRGLDRRDFVGSLAYTWATVDKIHFAREGNTRSQFVFFRQLAEQAGWELDTRAYVRDPQLHRSFLDARFYANATRDPRRLAAVLDQTITPLTQSPEPGPDEGMAQLLDTLRAAHDAHPRTVRTIINDMSTRRAAPPAADLTSPRDAGYGISD